MTGLGTVQDLAADEIQIQEAEDEVESRHPDQREQHVSGADDVAVAVLGAEQSVDQPRLAAELCRHPAGRVRDEGKREGQHQHPEERVTRLQASAEALEVGQPHQRDEDRAQAGHDVKGVVEELDVGGPGLRRKRIQAAHIAVERAVREEAEHPGNLDRVVDAALFDVRLPDDRDLGHRPGFEAALHRGEHRLLVARDDLGLQSPVGNATRTAAASPATVPCVRYSRA